MDNSSFGGQSVTFTDEDRRRWTRSLANARRMAIDLANGVGAIGDPEDIDVYRSEPGNVNDDRRKPLVWEGDFCLTYVDPDDGLASYGRKPFPRDCRFIPRRAALLEFGNRWDLYEHLGDNIPKFRAIGELATPKTDARRPPLIPSSTATPALPAVDTSSHAWKQG